MRSGSGALSTRGTNLVENPTHPTAHAPERASVYILGQFRTPKREMNMY